MRGVFSYFLAFAFACCAGEAAPFEAVSPDGRNRITYADGMVTVRRDNRTLFGPQPVALRLDRGEAKVELCARNDGVARAGRTAGGDFRRVRAARVDAREGDLIYYAP